MSQAHLWTTGPEPDTWHFVSCCDVDLLRKRALLKLIVECAMWPKHCAFQCPGLAWQLHIAMALPSKCAHHGTPATMYCAVQCSVFLKVLELGAIKCHKIQHPIHHWVLEIFQIWAWHRNLEMARKRQRIKWSKVVESVRGRSEREGRSEDKEVLELSKNWEAVGSCPFLKRQLLNRLPV